MTPLDLVRLTALMERNSGKAEVNIGLIDGPVAINHPGLAGDHIREILGNRDGTCVQANSTACVHGTFVAGILCAKRDSAAPVICPDCSVLIRPIFTEMTSEDVQILSATPDELGAAILDCIEAGVRVLNLSLALAQPSSKGERFLEEALDQAAKRSVIVVVAAGNQGTLGSTAITRHPWVYGRGASHLSPSPVRTHRARLRQWAQDKIIHVPLEKAIANGGPVRRGADATV